MSSERPSTPTPKKPEDRILDKGPVPVENSREGADYLNSKNRDFLDKMSDSGQKMANSLYEGIYATPGVNRLAGKMEIAYNQFWADKHEKQAVKEKTKMDSVDIEIRATDKAKKILEGQIENLRKKGLPGAEELQLEVKKMDLEQAKLAGKKDKFQTKFEARENKLKNYVNERDRVADKLIGYYDERLEPMEKELADLKHEGDRISLLEKALTVSHQAEEEDIHRTEEDIASLEETLKAVGKSNRYISRFSGLKILREQVRTRREQMKEEKRGLTEARGEINKQKAQIDEQANPKRDRRDAYTRIKQNRPLDINIPTRKRVVESTRSEEIGIHTRESTQESSSTETAEGKEKEKVSEYLKKWNEFLTEKNNLDINKLKINEAEFIGVVGSALAPETEIEFQNFKKVIEAYYKFKRVDAQQLNEKFDEFYKTKIIKQNP